MSLDAALQRHPSTAAPGHLLFARETAGGKRTYVSMSPAEAWKQTHRSKRTHLYEVLTGPCSFYLDIEWIEKEQPADERKRVTDIANTARKVLYTHTGRKPTVTSVTASGVTSKGYKCSWHLHYNIEGIAWSCAAAVGDFVRDHLSHIPEIDQVPYKSPTQNWRCVGSSKASEPDRVLGPCTHETFMACIVHKDAKNMIPRRQRACATVGAALSTTAVQVADMFKGVRRSSVQMCHDSNRFMVLPLLSKWCCIANREHKSNHPYIVVDLMCMRWRSACHNEACSTRTQPWQAMNDFDACKKLLPPPAPVHVPIKCNDAADLTVRSRGPPPVSVFSDTTKVVRCCNGCYTLPRAQ